jgi:hypothetical protein
MFRVNGQHVSVNGHVQMIHNVNGFFGFGASEKAFVIDNGAIWRFD